MNKWKIGTAVTVAGALAFAFTGTAHAGSSPNAVSPAFESGLPAMGYSTWYQYRTAANEADVLAEAQELVSSGLAAAGYTTVNLDDGWMLPARDSSGNLVADPSKFPDGMAFVSGKLHAMGLKLGIYEAIGTRTCQGFPGSYGHYTQDAALFASWQVDYVKADACGGTNPSDESSLATDFEQFGGDLRADSPDILFSQELPVPFIGTTSYGPAIQSSASWANSWRIASDEYLTTTNPTASAVIVANLNADIHLHGYAHSDHWNDLDFVIPPSIMPSPTASNYLTEEETQLGGWAIESSPMLVSTNLSDLSSAELTALKNPDVRAIDDSGAQSSLEVTYSHVEAFVKPAEGGTAVYLVNTGTGTASAVFTLAQLGISGTEVPGRNVWTGGTGTWGGLTAVIPAGGSQLLILQ